MTEKRRLQLSDLLQIEYLSSPALSPDGKTALYVISTGEKETGKFVQNIWKVDVESKTKALLLGDSSHQKLPRFSPDGKTIYYLSDKNSCKNIFQIWKLRDGIETQLTTLRHGVNWYSVSADGKKLAFEAPLWLEGSAPGDAKENALHPMSQTERTAWQKKKDMQPIVVEEVMYKFDETYGIPDGSITQIGYVSVDTGAVSLLTWEDKAHSMPVFSPNSTKIACWRKPYGGWKKKRGELTLYDLDGNVTQLTEGIMGLGETPVWKDNDTILYSGYYTGAEDVGGLNEDYFHGAFYAVSVSSRKSSVVFPKDAACWGPGAMATGHTAYGYPGDAAVICDGKLLSVSAENASTCVYQMDLEGKTIKRIAGEHCCVQGFAAIPGKVLTVKGSPEHIADLYITDTITGEETLVAQHNAWMNEVEMNHPQKVFVPSSDGQMIHGWILKPDGYEEGKKYPAVLDIHGGPECYYPIDWWFEFQYLASRGMAVVWCDPHGSISYGKAFQEGAWDDIAYEDLMTFLDHAISLGFIDPEKLGVTGGSYGGYMTNHIIGRNSRFAAAVSQRNLCNRATSYGTGDMGSIMEQNFRGCYHSLMNRMKGGSTTIKTIDKITTPLLILHATNDYRCSFEQGEQMFIAMKDRRPEIPVRFAAFLGENHGLTREGNMYSQKGHLLEMADWFEQYLSKNKKEEK